MATAAEIEQLRSDTGHSITTLDDVDAEAIYVLAGQRYSAGAVWAGARVITILQLLGSASKLRKYIQNNSTEDASVVFQNLRQLLGIWRDILADAEAAEVEAARPSAARFGRTTRKPARVREWPGS